jgi:hypothetical protein
MSSNQGLRQGCLCCAQWVKSIWRRIFGIFGILCHFDRHSLNRRQHWTRLAVKSRYMTKHRKKIFSAFHSTNWSLTYSQLRMGGIRTHDSALNHATYFSPILCRNLFTATKYLPCSSTAWQWIWVNHDKSFKSFEIKKKYWLVPR